MSETTTPDPADDVPVLVAIDYGDELARMVPTEERTAASFATRSTFSDGSPVRVAGYDPDRARLVLSVDADGTEPATVMIGTRADVQAGQGFRLVAHPSAPGRLEMFVQGEVWARDVTAGTAGRYISVLTESNR